MNQQIKENINKTLRELDVMAGNIFIACDTEVAADVSLKVKKAIKIINLLMDEKPLSKMKLLPTSEWHEDLGASIFVCFSRDENREILGEPPEMEYCSGYLESDFDEEKWTHFIDGDFDFMFSDADPINFPPK
tara:strand:- start:929 stop:1327 length:399 start_codon:yes stop_codon:yes gene_type:complete